MQTLAHMSRLACVLLLLAACGFGAAPPAMPWKIPPLDGELEGEFKPGPAEDAPLLRWKISARTTRPRERTIEFAIDGPGLRVRLAALLDPAGEGTWELRAAEADLAVWWSRLAKEYYPALAAAEVTGATKLTGAGVVRRDGFGGQVKLEVVDAVVRDVKQAWSVRGVAIEGRLGRLPVLATDEPVRLGFSEATVAGVELRDGQVEFLLNPDGTLRVNRALCSVLDGQVVLAPFVLDRTKNQMRTTVDLVNVDLAELREFLPAALSEARGRVSGRWDVVWDFRRGLTVASGGLLPGAAVSASIKLRPAPGFLTGRLPENMRERIQLMPDWLGPIGRLFAPANPAYPILRAIEMGESSLDIAAFEIGLSLDGDARGRSAHIVAMTRPTAKGTAVDSVRFEFNVTGPLADFARLLAEGRLNLQLR